MATLYPTAQSDDVGTPFFDEGSAETDGTEQTLIEFTVPPDTTRKLEQAEVSCAWDGTFYCKVNGETVRTGRTGPADRNVPKFWTPPLPMTDGDEFELTFKAALGVPIGMPVEASVMAADT